MLDAPIQSLRYAVRSLMKASAFTRAAVLTLALGIGAVTTLFNVLDGVLFKPLAYPDADRIVSVVNRYVNYSSSSLTGGDEIDIRAEPGIFEAFAYYQGRERGVQLGDRAELVGAASVHPDFFRVFGIAPIAGRPFHADDAERSAVVSLGFAQRTFGSAAGALGRPLVIAHRSYAIVGVMPAVMQFPAKTDVWTAAALQPANRNRTGHNYRAVAKLAPGVSTTLADLRLSALAGRLAAAFPDSNKGKTFVAVPLRDALVGDVRTTLYVLMAAVALLLLIACANVANLMLARGARRTRDVAVHAALGASPRRILAQSLVESLVLAAIACGLGWLLAYAGTSVLIQAGSQFVPLPRLADVQMDWRVLAFSVGASLLTAIVFGLMPAIQASRVSVKDALSQAGTRGAIGGSSSRVRSALVVAQVALSFVLAINAGLLFRAFVALTDAPLGFRSEGVLVAYAYAPARGSIFDKSGLDNFLRVGEMMDDVLGRLRGLPNVTSAGAAMGLPTGAFSSDGSFAVEGMHTFEGDFRRLPSAGFRLASPGYFETLSIPLLRGRDFDARDVYEQPAVAIVSDALARQVFGDADPLGRRIQCGLDRPDWMTIVGVVGDVRQASPASQPSPEIYMPLRQHPYVANNVQIVVRTRTAPESLIPTVQQTMRDVSRDVAMKFTTLEASVSESIAAPRFRATLIGLFASLALLLALGGTYAVMSYTAAQRMAEFGLRVALGADARDVARLVLMQAARLTLIGVAIGLALALTTSRVLTTFLFGITGRDVPTYVGVLLAAMPLVIAAAAIPAIRAARVDPIVALRAE